MLSTIPNDAQTFVAFMEEVWSAESEPLPDGGMILYQSPLYERYHNACHAIQHVATRTGSTKFHGKPARTWMFPNGTRAIVTEDGSMCMALHKPFKCRKPKAERAQ